MSTATMPLVTVGMTTYNRPESFQKALDGVINQTYKNLEIIISEDYSPCERTKSMLREYEKNDSRIKYISQKINLGPPTNIHFVLTQATGEYFMWADDDDLRDDRWIEVLLRNFYDDNTIAVIGNVFSMDSDGKPVKQHMSLQFSGPRILRLASYYLAEESEGKANIVCGLFRTDFIRQIKHWREYDQKYFGVDYLFVLDCIQHGNVLVDPSVSIYKRLPVGKSKPIKGLGDFIERLYRRLQYFIVCIFVVRNWLDRTVLLLLLPVKILKSFGYKIFLYTR